jgi:hypothetical protein
VLKKNRVLNDKVRVSINKSIKAFPYRAEIFFFCLKDRTSERSLTTLEMGKKLRAKARTQGFLISLPSPYGEIVPAFRFSHQREKEKASIVRFHLTCLQCVSMHRFAQTHLGGNRGFRHLRLKRVDPKPC